MGNVKIAGGVSVSELKYWLWLSNCSGVSANSKTELLEHFGSPEAAFAHSGPYFGIGGITRRESAELEKRELDGLERIERICRADGIRIITLEDEAYPERLRQIYSPPAVLYVTGKLPEIDDRPVISVIGTRRPTEYGIRMGYSLAYEITKCGGTVVSLLTAGVDASAANGAIEAGGPVIAVLGTSHDKAGGKLVSRAAAAGAVMSEYPPFTVPQKVFFRARNRIAAGISVGVAVAEAPEKSGTRLFVREAAEQGKDVFVIPGRIGDNLSKGCNELIKVGAIPVTSPNDILEYYGINQEEKCSDNPNGIICLLESGPKDMQTIIHELNMSPKEVLMQIFLLKQRGIIREETKGFFELK